MPARKKTVPEKKGDRGDKSEKVAAKAENLDAPADGRPPQNAFHIVGIGASAGGVQALENFFARMPSDCRMAFVIIQHLDPHHKSMMDSLGDVMND